MRFIPSGVVSRRVSYVYPSPRKRIRPYNYTFVGLERSIIHGPGGRLFAPQCAFRLRVRGDTVEPQTDWTTDTQIMRETLPTVLLLHVRCAFPPAAGMWLVGCVHVCLRRMLSYFVPATASEREYLWVVGWNGLVARSFARLMTTFSLAGAFTNTVL